MINKYDVIRYLLDEAEAQEKAIAAREKEGQTRWFASYGKVALILDNMKKIREIAMKISKEV